MKQCPKCGKENVPTPGWTGIGKDIVWHEYSPCYNCGAKL